MLRRLLPGEPAVALVEDVLQERSPVRVSILNRRRKVQACLRAGEVPKHSPPSPFPVHSDTFLLGSSSPPGITRNARRELTQ